MDGLSQAIIQFDQVVKRYRQKVVLDGLAVQVDAGRATVLLGENGAGKTTMVRLLCGLARPTAGTILVNGVPPENAKSALGVLFEDPQVYPHLDGHTNLELLAGRVAAANPERAGILAMVGLDESLLRRRAGGYSFGQRRRLTLAAVLCRDPQILVLDEPTNGLDPDGTDQFLAVMRAAQANKKTLLVTGQDLAVFESLADDVLILAQGRVIEFRDWRALRQSLPGVLFVRALPVETLRHALDRERQAGVQTSWTGDAVRITGSQTALQAMAAGLAARPDLAIQELRFQQPTLLDLYRYHTTGKAAEGPPSNEK